MRGRQAVALRQLVVAPRGGQRIRAAPALLAYGFILGNAPFFRCLRPFKAAGVVLAGQQAKTQRRIGQQRHTQAVHGFVQTVFYRAVNQAIRVLHRRHARQIVLFGQANELVYAVGCFVGQADVAHFSLLDQPAQRFELLVNGRGGALFGGFVVHRAKRRRVALGPVNLVKINHIGLQAFQAGIARSLDVLRRHARAFPNPGHAARRASHLGGKHQLLPHARIVGQPVADDLLGRAKGFGARRHGIHFSRINKIDTALHRAVQDGVGSGFIDLFAKSHGAQANRCYVQVTGAELNFIHEVFSAKIKNDMRAKRLPAGCKNNEFKGCK